MKHQNPDVYTIRRRRKIYIEIRNLLATEHGAREVKLHLANVLLSVKKIELPLIIE